MVVVYPSGTTIHRKGTFIEYNMLKVTTCITENINAVKRKEKKCP